MTIAELIKELQKIPNQNLPFCIQNRNDYRLLKIDERNFILSKDAFIIYIDS